MTQHPTEEERNQARKDIADSMRSLASKLEKREVFADADAYREAADALDRLRAASERTSA